MSTIYFVRHAQASFGKKNYDKLSDTGIKQSKILGQHLAKLGLSFDAMYSGEMERHKETLSGVVSVFQEKGLNLPQHQIMKDLNEYDSPEVLESQMSDMLKEDPSLQHDLDNIFNDKKSFRRIFEKAMFRWTSGNYDKSDMPGWKNFKDNVLRGLIEIMEKNGKGKSIIVFSSGGPISVVLQRALGICDEMTMRICWQIQNASINKFIYNSERLTLSSFNNTSHLELAGGMELITYR